MTKSPCESCQRLGGCAVLMCAEWKQWFAAEWEAVRAELRQKADADADALRKARRQSA